MPDGYYWITGLFDDVINVSGPPPWVPPRSTFAGRMRLARKSAVVGYPHKGRHQGPVQSTPYVTLWRARAEQELPQESGGSGCRRTTSRSPRRPDSGRAGGCPKTRPGKIIAAACARNPGTTGVISATLGLWRTPPLSTSCGDSPNKKGAGLKRFRSPRSAVPPPRSAQPTSARSITARLRRAMHRRRCAADPGPYSRGRRGPSWIPVLRRTAKRRCRRSRARIPMPRSPSLSVPRAVAARFPRSGCFQVFTLLSNISIVAAS